MGDPEITDKGSDFPSLDPLLGELLALDSRLAVLRRQRFEVQDDDLAAAIEDKIARLKARHILVSEKYNAEVSRKRGNHGP